MQYVETPMTSLLLIKSAAHSDRSGFAFVGMVLIVLCFAIGSSMVIDMLVAPASTLQTRRTQDRAAELREALRRFYLSHGGSAGVYPATLDALVADDAVACTLANNPAVAATYLTLQGWCGPYIDREFVEDAAAFKTDGWGTGFSFVQVTGVLTSCGPDRSCGTGDDIVFNP